MAARPELDDDALRVVLLKAHSDAAFKAKLLANAAEALTPLGITLPAGVTFRFVEDTSTVRHVVIPAPIGEGELADGDLDRVSGGLGQQLRRPDL